MPIRRIQPVDGTARIEEPLGAILLVLLSAILAACRAESPEPEAPVSPPVEAQASRGPIEATIRAAHETVTVGEPFAFTIEVLAEPEVEVRLPEIEKTLGVFDVVASDRTPDIPEAGKRRWTQSYTLSTYDDGKLEIPELKIPFVDRRNPDQSVSGELVTDPLTINVQSVLQGAAEAEPLHDIKSLVDVPVRRIEPWVWGLVTLFAIFVALMFAMLWIRHKRAGEAGEPPVPAHVWAMLQLDRLKDAGLVENRQFHAFYFRLSDIVRQYIERRFGFMAPERTTEEFLREIRRNQRLDVGHKELLAGFLRAADMVKFALHEPAPDDCHEALESAVSFVRETTPRPEDESADEPVQEEAA